MKNKKGFTLIELLSVIFILGILLLIAIPAAQKYLNKGTKTYYQNLEKTVLLAGKEYLNDYKVLLPRVIGNVEVIELKELTSNKYIKDVVDHNNKECQATVTVKKIAESKYQYYSCLKCEGYESKSENCGFNEDDNVAAGSVEYTIKVDDYYEVEQGTDFTLPIGEVYYKEEQVAIANPRPKIVDTNTLGETKITYSYKQVKKIVKIKVVDKTKPSKPIVVMRKTTSSGSIYTSGWYNGSIYQSFSSTDYTKPNVLGSGIDYYAISNNGTNYTKLTGTGTALGNVISSSGLNYLITSTAGEYTLYVKSVDKAGNESDAASYSFKIDKEKPKVTVSTSGTTATFTFTDNVGLSTYSVSDTNVISGKSAIGSYTATEGGTYTVYVKDLAGNTSNTTFTISDTLFCQAGQTWEFDYNGTDGGDGSARPFTAPSAGVYKLEVWGAQGGSAINSKGTSSNYGGYGGYSYGEVSLTANQPLYVSVGGHPGTYTRGTCTSNCEKVAGIIPGYNGGGQGGDYHTYTKYSGKGSSGGGATHIATTLRGTGILSEYASTYQTEVLIVAGGGGGAGLTSHQGDGGSGGGIYGIVAKYLKYDETEDEVDTYYGPTGNAADPDTKPTPATQTSGGYGFGIAGQDGTFGQGGSAGSWEAGGGGGGGLYGGGCGGPNHYNGGTGGSGYIGNSLLSNKGMYSYQKTVTSNNKTINWCTESIDSSTKTTCTTNVSSTPTSNYAKEGHGYAKITLLSCN